MNILNTHIKINITLILCICMLHTHAQTSRADSLYTVLMNAARPAIKTWVNSTATKYKGKEINETVIKATENFKALGNFKGVDIDALCFLAIMQVSKNSVSEIKKILASAKKTTKQNEMSEEAQLKLQQNMERANKIDVLFSNIMKAGNDTMNQIIANLK
jgi:ribosomal protein L12E/L44/L45/RPP1/RPP2